MRDEAPVVGEDYYFAGGYTNRDYATLIEAWGSIPAPLVIICSALNKLPVPLP